MASNPNASSQEDLILQQYAKARQNLQQQQVSGQQNLQDQINRTQAATGIQGGGALKAASKVLTNYNQGFAGQQAQLDAQQAQDLEGVAATKQAQGFQTQERVGSQDYASLEAQKQRQFQGGEQTQQLASQESQFARNLNFQDQQFKENRAEFTDQMNYQYQEFGENVKTNIINATVALSKAGIGNTGPFNITQYERGNLSATTPPPPALTNRPNDNTTSYGQSGIPNYQQGAGTVQTLVDQNGQPVDQNGNPVSPTLVNNKVRYGQQGRFTL